MGPSDKNGYNYRMFFDENKSNSPYLKSYGYFTKICPPPFDMADCLTVPGEEGTHRILFVTILAPTLI